MSRKLCENTACGVVVVSKGLSIVVAYASSALALALPLLNSAGATVKTTLSLTGLNFSFLSVILLGVWILSGLAGSHERHTSVALCIISSLGVPGFVLALLALGKL